MFSIWTSLKFCHLVEFMALDGFSVIETNFSKEWAARSDCRFVQTDLPVHSLLNKVMFPNGKTSD